MKESKVGILGLDPKSIIWNPSHQGNSFGDGGQLSSYGIRLEDVMIPEALGRDLNIL